MKKIFYLTMAAALMCSCAEDAEENATGEIYGIILDKATSEPIRGGGVLLSPTGTKTVTGNDGEYSFTELKAGDYTISVTKTGYADLTGHKITVAAGKTAKGDAQLEKLPPSLRVVNDSKQNIDTLDFGSAADDVTRSFSIFNDGTEPLEWQLTETSDWITNVSKTDGTLKAGATQAVIITIDRDKLTGGVYTTTIHITSDNGSKALTVIVTEGKVLPTLNTLEATNITPATATLHGRITSSGVPSYTERGFVYSTSSMPTVETTIAKLTAAVTASNDYDLTVTGLTLGNTYYVRAYAINKAGAAYSTNEVSFTTAMILPEVTTQAVSSKNIASGAATFNGTVVATGDPAYSERGFVYGVVHNPTVDDNDKKPASGSGTGVFSSNVTGLTEGNIYYIRAYATNSKGTAYGEEVSLDFNAVMPTLSTGAATDKSIGNGRVTMSGSILTVGDPAYIERGFAYGTAHNPTIADDTKKPVAGTSTGAFSANITDLTEGNIYYVRAYATNNKGTVYGEEVSVDFNAVMPTLTTGAATDKSIGNGRVTISGSILTVGDPAYTERGFAYGTTNSPTVDDDGKRPATGTGTGAFSATITNLTEGSVYYIRAYATNSRGTVYGEAVSVNFVAVMPTLTTGAATDKSIGNGRVTISGSILTVGDPAYTERGFAYGTTNSPTVDDDGKKPATGAGAGVFLAIITDLAEGSIYYVRAYATNSKGTVYGEEVSVDFNAVMPVVTTQEVSDITVNSAKLNGAIESIGDPAYTERGFVYATTENPAVEDVNTTKKIVSGGGTGSFSESLTNLTLGITYYVRTYATNSKGTVYGSQVSFVATSDDIVVLSAAKLVVQKTDASPNTLRRSNASNLCGGSATAGYTDWRLPTLSELSTMYANRYTIGGFVDNSTYWSSEDNSTYYYYLNMSTGGQGAVNSSGVNRARCVRTLE